MESLLKDCEAQMAKRIEMLDRELMKTRTGRASVSIVDGVRVNYYGTPTPLNQVASVSTPDARTVLVNPLKKK